jgi:hypothetical protein
VTSRFRLPEYCVLALGSVPSVQPNCPSYSPHASLQARDAVRGNPSILAVMAGISEVDSTGQTRGPIQIAGVPKNPGSTSILWTTSSVHTHPGPV